jgi:molybdopterin molybdotransferase
MTDNTLSLQSPQASLGHMLAHIKAIGPTTIELREATGRTLHAPIIAPFDQPPFAASAMDGYALASAETPGRFVVIGTASAGDATPLSLEQGQACRIFTGAQVPLCADCVVIQEDVTFDGHDLIAPKARPFQHVRGQGIDFQTGQTLLPAGTKMDPIKAALIAATGLGQIIVSKRPQITLLTGGDELVEPGQVRAAHQIYDSITTGLAALIRSWGGDARTLSPRRDDLALLEAGFSDAFAEADLVVTIGGASVGDKDLMKPALTAFEPQFLVNKVAVRPGKPVWFAQTKHCPVLGLPGNPASALVCAHLFLRPILASLQGQTPTTINPFEGAKLTGTLPQNGPREHYLRAFYEVNDTGQMIVTPAEQQDSALLSVFARANCLIRLMPNAGPFPQDALVQILRV